MRPRAPRWTTRSTRRTCWQRCTTRSASTRTRSCTTTSTSRERWCRAMWWVGFWAKSRGRQGAQKLKRRPATAAVLAYRLTPEHSMEVIKASRHWKITGDFAEGLILYWLSKSGYECARVDHTGIDLIAADPEGKHRMGISVK